MEPATAALIARAAIAAGTNKKVWTGIASVLAALCLPVILAVMCYISIASGGTEHNRAAVHLAFDGGEMPDGMPADYQAYVRQMQESFAELDAILDDIDGMTEGELCDRYLVKSVFILCISAQTGYGLRRMIIKNSQTVLWIMRNGYKT